MSLDLTTRETCRLCGSPHLRDILSLGNLCVSSFVSAEGESAEAAPLDLVLCDRAAEGGCGLLQLRHTVPADLLYSHYWYRSFTNESMRRALGDVTRSVEDFIPLAEGDVVLDIGCNDGTLLRSYRSPGVRTVGFEPSQNLLTFARQGTDRILNTFFNAASYREALGGVQAKAITTIAMFYDLEDPNTFVSELASCLDPGGIWVNQMSYLPLMLEKNAFDNICHEHLEYYSLSVLKRLLERHDLEVVDVELNDVNGGSFRVYAAHKGQGPRRSRFGSGRVRALQQYEAELGLDERTIYEEFAARVEALRERLTEFLRSKAERGERVYGYGASTKGNTLLQYFGLDEAAIGAIAERNPDKWGRRTIATNIPIISEEQARKDRPDYFLVLPWHFVSSFYERERDYLLSGGRFIVPLPEFQVVGG